MTITTPEDLKNYLNALPEDQCKDALVHVVKNGEVDKLLDGDVACASRIWADHELLQSNITIFAASKAINPNLTAYVHPAKGF